MKITDIIKDKLNILDVVGSYVKLDKAGKTYKGKSPFTNEKTPSFFVSPEKGFFYCFSSGKGGDMFTFIQEIERVDFREAFKMLAEKAGVDISQHNLQQTTLYDVQYKILDQATKWYETQLRKEKPLVEHLYQRGLNKETLIAFRIGYARDEWVSCYQYLTSRGYKDADIESAGLIKKGPKGDYYDRFRSRIMFPLFDSRGRVVGFSGRIVEQEGKEMKEAKYINSPEGPLYDKSKILYGYHIAKTEIAKEGYCILVEGQFDVLLSQQSGYPHTVAISGTGLSDDHILNIKRFTDTLYIALDADNAGIKATRRSVLAAYAHGMSVRVILLPEGMDPADTIVRSKEQWEVCVRDAQDYIDYRLAIFQRQQHSFEEKKSLIDNDIFGVVSYIDSAIIQDTALQKIALFLGVSIDAVRKDFSLFIERENTEQTRYPSSPPEKQEPKVHQRQSRQEEILYLYAYLDDEELVWNPDTKELQRELYQELYDSSLDVDLEKLDEIQKNMHLFILKERHKDIPLSVLEKNILISLKEEKVKRIEKRLKEILSNIRQADLEKDTEKIRTLGKEQHELLQLKETLTKE